FEDAEIGGGHREGGPGGFAEGDLVALQIIAQTIEMAEKIERPDFGSSDGGQHARPDFGGVGAADGFAIFVGFGELQAHGAYVVTEIERFNFEEVHEFILPSRPERLLQARTGGIYS